MACFRRSKGQYFPESPDSGVLEFKGLTRMKGRDELFRSPSRLCYLSQVSQSYKIRLCFVVLSSL